MKSRTTVEIYNMEFTLVSEESEEYVRKVAKLVDERMSETSAAGYSTVAAAVLAAANIADDYYKSLESADELRAQLRSYFEEISRLKDENDRLRRGVRAAEPTENAESTAESATESAGKPAAEQARPRRRGRPRTKKPDAAPAAEPAAMPAGEEISDEAIMAEAVDEILGSYPDDVDEAQERLDI